MGWLDKLHHTASIIGGKVKVSLLPFIAVYIESLEAQALGRYRQIPETLRGLLVAEYPEINLDDIRFADQINTRNGAAVTIGSCIYFPGEVQLFNPRDFRLLLHELEHCQQYARHGGVESFLIDYLDSFAVNVINHRTLNVHDALPLEREAAIKELRATPPCLVDPVFYLEAYGDLRAAFGDDADAAVAHWYDNGIAELRRGSPAFEWYYYFAHNQDLKSLIQGNLSGLIAHWLEHGIREGRVCSEVFDVNYYVSNNPDLQAAFGEHHEAAVKHWFDFGIADGRASSPGFNVRKYVSNYSDLQSAFGENWGAAMHHYLITGIHQGRIAT